MRGGEEGMADGAAAVPAPVTEEPKKGILETVQGWFGKKEETAKVAGRRRNRKAKKTRRNRKH